MNGCTNNGLRADQMQCPDCGGIAWCESVDIGVGLYLRNDFYCEACGWEYDADGKANVATYDDWFVEEE